MKRSLCVHGHFYQPPREDPATGLIPLEVAAAPFHDFNEKILSECYRPNAELGNFDRMSFDLGPTLGEWMRRNYPSVLSRIARADRHAVTAHGFGNAMMQSHHHTILPLASERDRRTELRWGRRWFEMIFGRQPRGIWLPETAVDLATLEACADEGLTFTILSPEQAMHPIDPQRPYRVELPSGRDFAVVFYQGPLSGTVSFDPAATTSAADFIENWVLPHFHQPHVPPALSQPIVAIASDGEVYGHHHAFKDHFLQDLLYVRGPAAGLEVESVEQYLGRCDIKSFAQVLIKEWSSWGCGHLLLRWRGDCPCTDGDGAWKQALRTAFDELAEQVDQLTDDLTTRLDLDPWTLRDDYIDVVLGQLSVPDWLGRQGLAEQTEAARTVLALMEAQRWRLAMYASCAFYWDDLTRIEAGYGVRSGLHAAGLLDRTFGTELGNWFADRLSGITGWKSSSSARDLYVSRT